jgi:hypothetical protein
MGAREAYTASSSQCLPRNTPDIATCALERRPWPEPIAVDPHQNNPGVLRAAVDAFQGDLLVVEVCHSEEKRGLPSDDEVRNVLGDPPCDLLFVRGSDNSKAQVKGADDR